MDTATPHWLTADAQPLETLRRLGRMETDGHPVLSVYVDLDPSRFPTPGARATQIRALLSEGRRQAEASAGAAVVAGLDRVGRWLEGEAGLAGGGLAVFAAPGAGMFEAVRLAEPVEPMVAVDARPWLEPLAAALTGGDWVVALVGRAEARVLRGGPRSLAVVATVTDVVHRRHAQGGWSQAGYQRGIEHEVAEHLRRTALLLLRAHERRPFEHLVVGASDEVWPEIVHALHPSLRDRLAGRLQVDATADADAVAQALSPIVERVERERELALLAQLEAGLGTSGRSAAGLAGVLAALDRGRVRTLLVADGARLTGRACPRCGRLSAAGEVCAADGAELEAVDAAERAVDAAIRQSATVVVVHHETDALGRGAIAALLRY